MAGVRTIRVRFDGDVTGLQKAAASGEKSLSGWGKKIAVAGAAATAGLAAVGGAALLLGTQLMPLSRRMADLDVKSRAVFGGQLAAVQKWAETNKRAFGATSREIVGMAANMADLLKPMGFTEAKAAAMSTKMVDLSGALSKWSGGTRSAAEVSEILSAALLGERDALQGLGISISQAEIDAALAKKGQEDLTGAARQQAEAIATQELIFAKSTDAQKAWAQGGKAAAEAQNGLNSRIAEAKERLAGALTPAITRVMEWLTKFADWMQTTGIPALKDFGGAVKEKLGAVIDWARGMWEKIQPALRTVWNIIGPMLKGALDNLKKAWEDLRPALASLLPVLKIVGIIIGVVIALAVVAVVALLYALAFVVRNVLVPVWKFFLAVGKAVANGLVSAWDAVWKFFTKTLPHLWDNVKAATTAAKNWIVARWNDAVGFVKGLPKKISSAVSGMWDGIKTAFRNALNWIVDKWNNFHIPAIKVAGVQVSPQVDFPNLPRFHSGGVVPGPFGREVPILARAGETVLTREQARGGDIEVRVFIGDQELRGLVRTEVRERDRGLKRGVLAGAGAR